MNQIESGLKSAMCKAVSQAFDLEYSEEQLLKFRKIKAMVIMLAIRQCS